MINRRGSTGYGQKFTDEITNDYGGKAYVDVMNGVDYSLKKYPFIDGTRMAAAGGSFGGGRREFGVGRPGRGGRGRRLLEGAHRGGRGSSGARRGIHEEEVE